MDNALRKEITQDLLRNSPKGPGAFYKLPGKDNNFGYSDHDIFQLGFKSEYDCRSGIIDIVCDGKMKYGDASAKRTLTRRTKRLWGRLQESIKKTKKQGGMGIYKIRSQWGFGSADTLGYVYSQSHEEAQKLGEVLYTYLVRGSNKRIGTDFVEFADESRVSYYENQLKDKFYKIVISERKKHQESGEMIEYLTMRLDLLTSP
jgi:hypothetical protein